MPVDDPHVPLKHRRDATGRAYARWKEHGGIGGWEEFQRQRGDERPPLLAEEATPEQKQAAFRRDNDSADLSAEERALLEVGVAPTLTPARLARRAVPFVGFFLVGTGVVARWLGASWPVVVALLVVGFVAVIASILVGAPRKRPKRR